MISNVQYKFRCWKCFQLFSYSILYRICLNKLYEEGIQIIINVYFTNKLLNVIDNVESYNIICVSDKNIVFPNFFWNSDTSVVYGRSKDL